MNTTGKRRAGFDGQKLISIPEKVLRDIIKRDPALFKLYISHIGYFPKAYNHYRKWNMGCDDTIVFYCLHGKGYCLLDNTEFTVLPNQFIIIPATNKSISYWADDVDPWTIYWIHFRGKDIKSFIESLNFTLASGPVKIPFNEKAISIWSSMYECLEKGYSRENMLKACFPLYHFLIELIYPGKQEPDENGGGGGGVESKDIVAKIIMFMRSKIETRLSVDEMAAYIGLSTSRISGLFKKSTGMPLIDYFIHLKMQKACQLLNSREARIKSVSYALGYDDPYYFSRLFKKVMGMSPEQYKLNMNQ